MWKMATIHANVDALSTSFPLTLIPSAVLSTRVAGRNATHGTLADLFSFRNDTSGQWARLVVDAEHMSGVYFDGDGELRVLRSSTAKPRRGRQLRLSSMKFAELPRSPAWHAIDAMLRAPRPDRRRLQVPSGPPYGRLVGCEHQLRVLRMGFLIDSGFVAAAGGTAKAVNELSNALHLINGLFEDQLGLRLEARHVVVRSDPATAFAEAGPDSPRGPRPRPADAGVLVSQGARGGPRVLDIAPSALLGRFSQWVGEHAPAGAGLWHLLTDAFPPPGVVGLATLGAACTSGSQPIYFNDLRVVAPSGFFPRTTSGTRVAGYTLAPLARYGSVLGGGRCPSGSSSCVAAAGLSSRSTDLWLTMAHELGHSLNAEHTFGRGGRMAYGQDVPFVANGAPADMCAFLSMRIREDEASLGESCLPPATSECGNGVLETGEGCDDGNRRGGDGCDGACEVECGWRCVQRPLVNVDAGVDVAGRLQSECTRHCGDGIVQREHDEECDLGNSTTPLSPFAACCNPSTCRLVHGAACAAGACCDADTCQYRPAATACAGGAGFCALGGTCEQSWPRSLGQYTVGTDSAVVDLNTCPVDGCAFRFALRGSTGTSPPPSSPSDPPVCWSDPTSPADFHVPDGTLCANPPDAASGDPDTVAGGTPSAADGICRGGTCESVATCGDGIVAIGEECDDVSPCCVGCRRVGGCSPPGACCTATCQPALSPTSCAGGLGYCDGGECIDSAHMCTAYGNLRLNLTSCPVTASQPCVVYCAVAPTSANALSLAASAACRPRELPQTCYAMGRLSEGAPCALADAVGAPAAGVCSEGICTHVLTDSSCPPPPPAPVAPPPSPPPPAPDPPNLPPAPPSEPPPPILPAPPGGYSPPPGMPTPATPSPLPPPLVTRAPPPDFGGSLPSAPSPPPAQPPPLGWPPPAGDSDVSVGVACAPPPPTWWSEASPPALPASRAPPSGGGPGGGVFGGGGGTGGATNPWASRITRWLREEALATPPFAAAPLYLPRWQILCIVAVAALALTFVERVARILYMARLRRKAATTRAAVGGGRAAASNRIQPVSRPRSPRSRRSPPSRRGSGSIEFDPFAPSVTTRTSRS